MGFINRGPDQRFGGSFITHKTTDRYLLGFTLQNHYVSCHLVHYRKIREQTRQAIRQCFIIRTERCFLKSTQQRWFVRKGYSGLLLDFVQDFPNRGLLHVQRNHPCFIHSICLCLKAGQTKNHHHYYQGNTGKLFCRVYFLHLVICWYLFLRQIFRKYPYQVRQKKLNLGIFPFFAYLCRRVRDINHYCIVLLIILSRSLL